MRGRRQNFVTQRLGVRAVAETSALSLDPSAPLVSQSAGAVTAIARVHAAPVISNDDGNLRPSGGGRVGLGLPAIRYFWRIDDGATDAAALAASDWTEAFSLPIIPPIGLPIMIVAVGASGSARIKTAAIPPAAFTVEMWEVESAPLGGSAIVTLLGRPAGNGASLTRIDYSVNDGPWINSGAAIDADFFLIPGLTNGVSVSVRLAAVSSAGSSSPSDSKDVIPTVSAARPSAFAPADWSVTNVPSAGGNQASIGLTTIPAGATSIVWRSRRSSTVGGALYTKPAPTVTVTNSTELSTQITSAAAGAVIGLQPGSYTMPTLDNRDRTTAVSLVSIGTAADVILDDIDGDSGTPTGWHFYELTVTGQPRFVGGSNIHFYGCRLPNGTHHNDGSNIRYFGCRFGTLPGGGGTSGQLFTLNRANDIEIIGNEFLGSGNGDQMQVKEDVDGLLIRNNIFFDPVTTEPLAHPDMIQFFASAGGTPPTNVTIEGNLFWDRDDTGNKFAQPIFLKDSRVGYRNFLIRNNMIATNSPNGIYVDCGVENIIIENNSLIAENNGGGAIRIENLTGLGNAGVIVRNNICRIIDDAPGTGWTNTNNYLMSTTPTAANHASNVYTGLGANAQLDPAYYLAPELIWNHFRLRAGGPISAASGFGAVARLAELETAGSWTVGGAVPGPWSTPTTLGTGTGNYPVTLPISATAQDVQVIGRNAAGDGPASAPKSVTPTVVADTTAPILSNPVVAASGSSAMTGSIDTNEATGTIFVVVTTSSTPPTIPQVQNGQNHLGVSVPSGAFGVTALTRSFSIVGLQASTTYFTYFMHRDPAGNRSAVVSASSFTTAAASPTPVYVGGTTANSANPNVAVPLNALTGGIGSAPQVGDFILVNFSVSSNSDRRPGMSAGGGTYTNAISQHVNDTYRTNVANWWKIATEADLASVTVGLSAGIGGGVIGVQVWRGVNQTNPMDVVMIDAEATSSRVPNPPNITPITQGSMIIAGGACAYNGATLTPLSAPALSNVLTAERNINSSGVNYGVSMLMGSIPWSGTGPVDLAPFTIGASTADDTWIAWVGVLRPA